MTQLLNWSQASRSDRKVLNNFVCTEPAKATWNGSRLVHPRDWELDVQSGIRALRPPLGPDTVLLLGKDQQRCLAAVVLFSDTEGKPSEVVLRALAVATHIRGAGGAHAREALSVALRVMAERARAAGARELFVFGRIHPRNGPSKRLCKGAGFEYLRMQDDVLEIWTRTIALL